MLSATLPLIVRLLTPADSDWVRRFIRERWGAEEVVAHGVVYRPHTLPGFTVWQGEEIMGLATYCIVADQCELVTLDSLQSERGVGTALIEVVRQTAVAAGCRRLWLITTNDNLRALRFYQKRGFHLVAVHPEAVTRSRAIKPQIPLIGEQGIPLRDELELEMRW